MKYAELNTPCFGVNAPKNHHQVFQVKSVMTTSKHNGLNK